MPDLSGLDVCRFVRQSKDAGELPILILTASGSRDSLVDALEAGANDFVVKPIREEELRARVVALLRNKALYARLAITEQRLVVEAEFRERFIGMLAHDLRQPLNTFKLANQSLSAANPLPAALLLGMQQRAADRMLRMINELLDFTRSRPESGMPVFPQIMDFSALVQELVEEVRVGNPTRTFDLCIDGACSGSWDRDRLAQLCSNLLQNAIEHGALGAPIRVSLAGDAQGVALSVVNEGEPIPESLMPVLFDPFRQGRGKSQSGGVGLGLHIVSEIARAHRGGVEARSDLRETAFTVTIPLC
jgi:signal transduction histidine kinase